MEYSRDAIILQLVGDTRLINNFIDLMRDYDILESCRTGVISLSRGVSTMRDGIA
jgi:acetolactate synthase-1/3 small subunit